MRPLVLTLALAAAAAATSATPATAAPARCTAVVARSCTYQSSGTYGDFACAAGRCGLYVDGSFVRSSRFGETFTFWAGYADVVLVVVYDAGAAHAGDSPFPRP